MNLALKGGCYLKGGENVGCISSEKGQRTISPGRARAQRSVRSGEGQAHEPGSLSATRGSSSAFPAGSCRGSDGIRLLKALQTGSLELLWQWLELVVERAGRSGGCA